MCGINLSLPSIPPQPSPSLHPSPALPFPPSLPCPPLFSLSQLSAFVEYTWDCMKLPTLSEEMVSVNTNRRCLLGPLPLAVTVLL